MIKFKKIPACLILLTLLLSFACDSTVEEDETPTIQSASAIYFRIQQNNSHPNVGSSSGCEEEAGDYIDDNPDVAADADFNVYYGPVAAGTYHGNFNLNGVSNEGPISFTYQLEAPAPGFKRLYSQLLKQYNPGLNRCLNVSSEPTALTFTDVPL